MRSSNPRHAVSRHGSVIPRSESHNAGEAVCDPAPMCRGTQAAALRGSDLCLTHLHTSPLPSGVTVIESSIFRNDDAPENASPSS